MLLHSPLTQILVTVIATLDYLHDVENFCTYTAWTRSPITVHHINLLKKWL